MKKILILCSILLVFSAFVSADNLDLDVAIGWLYGNGLTTKSTIPEFKPDQWLRRDEAAKFFVQFAHVIWKNDYIKTDSQCSFSDSNQAWSDLKDFVTQSCKLGLFQGNKGKFSPKTLISNAQAVAVLMRLLVWSQGEVGLTHRSDNYYKKANELKLLDNVTMNNVNGLTTRGNVAIFLHNWYISQLQTIGIPYTNDTYNFTLKLPPDWSGYSVDTSWTSIRFSFPQQQNIFYIVVLSKEEWASMQNDLMWPSYLWENSGHVFVYWSAQDAVNQDILNRMGEINTIVKTFAAK